MDSVIVKTTPRLYRRGGIFVEEGSVEIKGWNVDRTVARRAPKLNPLPIILAAVPFMASLLMPVPNWFTGLLGAIFGAAVSVSVMTHLRGRYDLQCKLDQALDTLMHASS